MNEHFNDMRIVGTVEIFNDRSAYRVSIDKKLMTRLNFKDIAYFGYVDDAIFLSEEEFSGSINIKRQIKTSWLAVPSKIMKALSWECGKYLLKTQRGDLFLYKMN